MTVELRPGLSSSVPLLVTAADTALALGSGDVPVLATPRVVALVEEAACQVLVGHLDPGDTSVGARIALDHLLPTRVGATVTATASLTAVDGRTLDFDVVVHEDDTPVARGVHRRVLAPRASFGG